VWGAGSGGRGRRQNPAALTCGELYHPLSSFGSAGAGCNLKMFNLTLSPTAVIIFFLATYLVQTKYLVQTRANLLNKVSKNSEKKL